MSTEPVADRNRIENESRQELNVWAGQVRAFAQRSMREVAGSWEMMLTAIGLPAGMYLLIIAMGDGMLPEIQATQSVGIGIFGAMIVCLYVFGNLLVIDIEDHRYTAYRAMGVYPSADLVGRMLAGLVVAAVSFLSALIAGVLTGAAYELHGIESVSVVLFAGALACVFWMVIAIPIVVVANNERYAEWGTMMIVVVASVVTGFHGVTPADSFIEGELLNSLPNTLPTRLIAYHIIEDAAGAGLTPPDLPVGPEFLALLAVYTVVAVALGTLVLKKSLYGTEGW